MGGTVNGLVSERHDVTVLDPLPHIADDVVDPKIVGLQRTHRCHDPMTVVASDGIPRPESRCRLIVVVGFRASRLGVVTPTPRRRAAVVSNVFPLGFRRQPVTLSGLPA